MKQNVKSKVKRLTDRASYDRATINAILDEAVICHVGFCDEDVPYVIPMAFARYEDTLYLHGSAKTRIAKTLATGAPVCVTVTHLDGLVMAKSYFHHSMNYRSAVLFGTCREVQDLEEKNFGLEQLMIHLAPGQEGRTRAGNRGEMKATSLLHFTIQQASAKIRTGPPKDASEDADLDLWTGVLPLSIRAGEPITEEGDVVPAHIMALYGRYSS